jgi:hypothetical protein
MNKRIFLFLLLCAISTTTTHAQLRPMPNTSFGTGEIIKFRVHYGFINAGYGQLQVMPNTQVVSNANCMHIVGTAQSNSTFDKFFKVRDRYETYLDADAIVPHKFVRQVNEGGYVINQNMTFDHQKNTAYCYVKKQTYTLAPYSQDILSAFFYARAAIDIKKVKVGDVYPIPVFLDYEHYQMGVRYLGKVNITTELGKFRCLKFTPQVQKGRIFTGDEEMYLYVTDDENKAPILIKASVLVGSIEATTTSLVGLKYPLTSKIK